MKLHWKIKSASGFKLDLAANFAGVGWSFLMQVACIPLYLRFLGIEAYGLIGFYLMLQAILQVLDFGLSPTMNREMARYSVQPEKAGEARDLVRTLEAGYWLVGIAIGAVILAAAPVIARDWIKASAIPVHDLQHIVMLMGVLAVFQWPASFYQGGLMGLGRQVLYNGFNIFFSTLSSGGAVLILWLVSPTIQAFFLWLVAVNAAKAVLLAIFLWKSLPLATRAPQFNLRQVRNIWRFAAGMSGITACALILTQSDKLIVSKLFNLKIYGYYILAGMFGVGLSMITGAVFNTIFNRFSGLVAVGNEEALKHLYHRCTQLMAVLILPLAAVLALFSTDILQFWTRNAEVARNAGPIATLLVIGSALNSLMNLPYALQLANGWTSLNLWLSIFLTLMLVPAIWFMATHYGPVGAASVWIALNCCTMAISVPLMHRRLLKGEMVRWFTEDVGLALAAVFVVVGSARALTVSPMRPLMAVAILPIVLLSALLAGAFAAPQIRNLLIEKLSKIRLGYA
jgi:O-antigen/teichoic acid export membrane protein